MRRRRMNIHAIPCLRVIHVVALAAMGASVLLWADAKATTVTGQMACASLAGKTSAEQPWRRLSSRPMGSASLLEGQRHDRAFSEF